MLAIATVDAKRLLSSKLTWTLVAGALAMLAVQTLNEASGRSFALAPAFIDTSGFVALLEDSSAIAPAPYADIVGREAPPSVRFMTSLAYLDSVVLAAMVVFGGFFAADVGSGYDVLRRSRGVSARRVFLANALSVVAVSAALSGLALSFLAAVCAAAGAGSVNAAAHGQMVLQQVFFLPQVAASLPAVYVVLIGLIYTAILTFVGLVGVVSARATRGNVLLSGVAPAGLIFVAGGRVSSHLPWPFWAFDFENLSFAERFITEPRFVVYYVGGYAVWIAVLVAFGVCASSVARLARRAASWVGR